MTSFKYIEKLGSGTESKVYSIRSEKSGNVYACKVVKPEFRDNAIREGKFLEMLSESKTTPKYTPKFYCTKLNPDNTTLIVIELFTGNTLLDLVQSSPGVLGLDVLRVIFRQLLRSVKHMHAQGIVHRDIKAENIVFRNTSTYDIVVIDFGFAGTWESGKWLYEDVGSMDYAPPEILKGHPYRGPEVDLFALGVVFYICLTGEFPYKHIENKDVRLAIESRNRAPYFKTGTDALVVDLISQMLQYDRGVRYTSAMNIDSLIEHPFFKRKRKLSAGGKTSTKSNSI